ncbi:MAG: tyrosine-type recombinase/integrase [Nitrospinae bacterium]|nr:tyrosine-type recombinase/integrase [Nitrospinota bacterium]
MSKKVRRNHIDPTGIQKTLKKASIKAGINKNVTCQTLRHSFAMHLLESGCPIRKLQELMGHRSIDTTMKYVKVFESMDMKIARPLDLLDLGDE